MKATIKCNNGNTVELEGTPAEISAIIQGFNYYQPVVSIPSIWGVYCAHEYPNPWHGVTMPACIKCGSVQPSYIWISGEADGYNLPATTVTVVAPVGATPTFTRDLV